MYRTIGILLVIAAVCILISTYWLPVFRIYGNSMEPTIQPNEIVAAVKSSNIETGDIIAFYYNNKIMVKRVIAVAGETIDLDEKGNVYIDGILREEAYIAETDSGQCDIDLPCLVAESHYFVMGDNRSVSIDSRSSSLGCISEDMIIGKVVCRLWPLKAIGNIE